MQSGNIKYVFLGVVIGVVISVLSIVSYFTMSGQYNSPLQQNLSTKDSGQTRDLSKIPYLLGGSYVPPALKESLKPVLQDIQVVTIENGIVTGKDKAPDGLGRTYSIQTNQNSKIGKWDCKKNNTDKNSLFGVSQSCSVAEVTLSDIKIGDMIIVETTEPVSNNNSTVTAVSIVVQTPVSTPVPVK